MLRIKSAIIAATAAAAFVMAPAESKADVDIHFGFTAPGFGIYTDRGHRYRHHAPRYDRRHRYRNARMSCSEARRLVRSHGFRRIRPLDCSGRVYTFRARRHGEAYRIRVNARQHSISRVRRIS